MVPFGNGKTGRLNTVDSVTCALLGEWSRPDDVPAVAKKRFGQVGPGTDENQLSQTANWLARKLRTGS